MSTPKPSLLDSGQTLQGSFDEETGSLRTKTDANESSVEVFQLDPESLNINSHLVVNNQSVNENNPIPTVQQTDWDEIVTTFPASNVELYTYKLNSEIIRTITVTYETSTKKIILSIQKTSF